MHFGGHISLSGSTERTSAMKYLIILTVVTFGSAAKLDKVYLPPNARASSGATAGLQTPLRPQGPAPGPFGGSQRPSAPGAFAPQPQRSQGQPGGGDQAEILKYENEMTADGFRYAYETSDGTKAEQTGKIIPGAKPEEGSLQVAGSYSYIGDDGKTYSVTYTADENGFHAEGAHLPTPPPIPEAILKSLELTAKGAGGATGPGQYGSPKSSYDADFAGYQK